MTASLTPPPQDESKDGVLIKGEPSPSTPFTPHPSLSPTSTRKDIYAHIDSLASFHLHHAHFAPAPEWDRLYACVRSYKKSHPRLPDIATAFQHHRRQVLGILSDEDRTPSIDRLRKRRDRQQQNDKAKRQRRGTRGPGGEGGEGVGEVVGGGGLASTMADLSASVALSSFHSAPPVSEPASRCGCGAMVEANRRLQEELRRKDALVAALQHKLAQMRQILDGDAVVGEQKDNTPQLPPALLTVPTASSSSSTAQPAVLSPLNSGLALSGSAAVNAGAEWPEFYPSLWPNSGDVQCGNCTCCSWKLD